MRINEPAVLAELNERHAVYEKALIENDVGVLDSFYWDSPQSPHGVDDRVIERLDMTSFGDSAGIVNLEFICSADGSERRSRQTLLWIRFPDGWKIVSAHESLLPSTPSYADVVSEQIGMKIPPGSRGLVEENLNQIANMARTLMEFPLDQDVEAAPVFQP